MRLVDDGGDRVLGISRTRGVSGNYEDRISALGASGLERLAGAGMGCGSFYSAPGKGSLTVRFYGYAARLVAKSFLKFGF